jgi:CheY-like chemotaxis protein
MHVLLVDDSAVMRRYLARALNMIGEEITVYEAENGFEGVLKAFSIKPDLIITDLNMPGMNGEELVARVHGATELRGISVLVVSADRFPGRPDRLMHAGAVAYLTKPVTPETLRTQIDAIIESRK